MAIARKCDRCGCYYDTPSTETLSGFQWLKGGVNPTGVIGLCADCCDMLSDWIEGDRETLTEKTEILGDTFLEDVESEQVKGIGDAAEEVTAKGFVSLLEEIEPEEPEPEPEEPEEVGEVVTSEPDKPTWGDRAREITRDYLNGMKRRDIAEKYGVKPRTVSNSINLFRKNHSHEYERMIAESSVKNR